MAESNIEIFQNAWVYLFKIDALEFSQRFFMELF